MSMRVRTDNTDTTQSKSSWKSRWLARGVPQSMERGGEVSNVDGGAFEVVHEGLRYPHQPLDPATCALMELRFGYNFSKERVHSTRSKMIHTNLKINKRVVVVRDCWL